MREFWHGTRGWGGLGVILGGGEVLKLQVTSCGRVLDHYRRWAKTLARVAAVRPQSYLAAGPKMRPQPGRRQRPG
jgi:hypothetical protein